MKKMTDNCENITFPNTAYVVDKNISVLFDLVSLPEKCNLVIAEHKPMPQWLPHGLSLN